VIQRFIVNANQDNVFCRDRSAQNKMRILRLEIDQMKKTECPP